MSTLTRALKGILLTYDLDEYTMHYIQTINPETASNEDLAYLKRTYNEQIGVNR